MGDGEADVFRRANNVVHADCDAFGFLFSESVASSIEAARMTGSG